MFLGIDGILNVLNTLLDRLVVNPVVIKARLESNLPFMASENILMEAVKRGGDRQVLHERLRVLSRQASEKVARGEKNDLLERIISDPLFHLKEADILPLLSPEKFIGLAQRQCETFLENEVLPYLARSVEEGIDIEVNV